MKKRLIYVVLLWVAMVATTKVWADVTIDMSKPGEGGNGWTVSGEVVTIAVNGSYVVTGATDTHRLEVAAGVTAKVTLHDCSIRSAVASAFTLLGDNNMASDVRLHLEGSNELVVTRQETNGGVRYYATLQVEKGARLTVEVEEGSLVVTGGYCGAGIGGGYTEVDGKNVGDSVGNIVINGGHIVATGGDRAAGIGGGAYGNGGSVVINGGEVMATGGATGAAGIGGGAYGSGGTVMINDGEVTAIGGAMAAGIGGGYMGDGEALIVGGKVTAQGGYSGAGIGGGHNANGTVSISGGTVTATGGWGAAGIGGGQDGGASNKVSISGGSVVAISGIQGAGIGGGTKNENNSELAGSAGAISISGGTVYAYGVQTTGVGAGASIGAGLGGGMSGSVNITGGSIIANTIGYCVNAGGAHESQTFTAINGAGTIVFADGVNGTPVGEYIFITGTYVSIGPIALGDDQTDVTLHADFLLPPGSQLSVPDGLRFDINHYNFTIAGAIDRYSFHRLLNAEHAYYTSIQPDWVIPLADRYYTAQAHTPQPRVVTHLGARLYPGEDYKLVYINNVDTGKATVRIEGYAPYNAAPCEVNFRILPNPLYHRDTIIISHYDTVYRTVEVEVIDTVYTDIIDTVEAPYYDTIWTPRYVYDTVVTYDTMYYGVPVEVIRVVHDTIIREIEVRVTDTFFIIVDHSTDAEYPVTTGVRAVSQGADVMLLDLEAGKPFAVYTLRGERCANGTVPAGGTLLLRNVSPGTYILRQGERWGKFEHRER